MYDAVNFVKETPTHGLTTFTDSSFANAELKSQYGVLVFRTPPTVNERPAKATLLDWKSARTTRVCRSTLAAESSAADEGADRATFTNVCLSELLCGEAGNKTGSKLSNTQVTDAKSLYDCVVAENPNSSDKRSLINIRSVQQSVSGKDFRWVPTI